MQVSQSGRLSPLRLLIFALPVCALQSMELPWRIFLPAFLSQNVGLSLATVGGLLMGVRLFDVAADPIVGWLSDHLWTGFGRRRPWIIASLPVILGGTWGLFFASPGTAIANIACACVMLHFGFVLLVIPHGGWAIDLGSDERESTRIMAARMWCLVAATPIVMAMPIFLEHRGADRAIQMAAFGGLIMAATPLAVLLLLMFHREPGGCSAHGRQPLPNPFTAWRTLLADRALVVALGLYALAGLSDAAGAATLLFFLDQCLGLGHVANALILVPALVALVTTPFWSTLGNRLGKSRALLVACAWNAAAAGGAWLLPEGRITPLIVFLGIRGLSWGADYVLLRSIIADIVNANSRQPPEPSGASAYAFCNVTMKISAALGAGAALVLLARLGFVPGETASPGGKLAVRAMTSVPPMATAMLSMLILKRNPNFGRTTPLPRH